MAQRSNERLWQSIKSRVQRSKIMGTAAGQWSARKAQLSVQRYKAAGGGYRGPKRASNHLVRWTREHWTTKSGRPSHVTGERYLPRAAIKHLSARQYASTSYAKRHSHGRQYVPQPKAIAAITKRFRS